MAAVAKKILLNQNITVTTNGDKVTLNSSNDDFVGFIEVTNYASGTITGKIEHSPDNGSNWFDLASFTAASGNTAELKQVTGNVLGTVRAVATTAGSDADVRIELLFKDR